MGIKNSKNKYKENNEEIICLKKRLDDLEKADHNDDGVVTKEEFQQWAKNQNNNSIKILNELQQENTELQKQIASLRNINNVLENKLKNVKVDVNYKNGHNDDQERLLNLQELSEEQIEKFVMNLLNNKEINIGYLPDFVEKQIYKNVFNLLINILENLMETTTVNFMGHQIMFSLVPNDIVHKNKNVNVNSNVIQQE